MHQYNNFMLDANAILRFLLRDIEEQYQIIKAIIANNRCYATLEVIAEVCYVLEGVYSAPRSIIADSLRLLNNHVIINDSDVFLRALEIYDEPPKLDFVDCLMYGFKKARGIEIFTFDKKLLKKLNEISL